MVNIFGDRGGAEGRSRGERGPIGPTGSIGPLGLKGKEGVRGPKGSKGDQGVVGSKGDQGVAGDRGVAGPKGSPSTITDLCTWMPHTVLKNLQENEELCCFFIADPNKDIKREGSVIKQWITRSQNKLNLTAERASKSIVQVTSERHALVFQKNRYISDDLLFIPNHSGTYGFVCVTYRTSAGDDAAAQVILSNSEKTENFHEIYVTATEIGISGRESGKAKCVIIKHPNRNWTTLFLEYTALEHVTKCNYIINNNPHLGGAFTFDSYEEMSTGFAVGSRYDNTRFLQGEIASIEMYHGKGNKQIPQAVKDLVIKNQLIESSDIGNEGSPPVKKKKNIKITVNNINDEPPVKRNKINQSESC
jgi:hypothetical protein